MGRVKILRSSKIETCWGYAINSAYDLNLGMLLSLANTLESAQSTFDVITAVRLDFSIKKAPIDEYIGCSNTDIMDCFTAFMNRLYKVPNIEYFMNWKLEWSESKGFHLHSVFYFNHLLSKTFTLTSNVYQQFEDRWDKATDGNGNINICTSSIAIGEDSYSVRGEQSYHYTILKEDIASLNKMNLSDATKRYHQQKNLLSKKCGFFHWVSYLAKVEQLAPSHRKCFGSRNKLVTT